jgi:N-methylhydantoinase A
LEGEDRPAEAHSTRQAYFPELGGFVDCPAYRRDELDVGAVVIGPAIVEEKESTSVLLPNDVATVDRFRNLLIDIDGGLGR